MQIIGHVDRCDESFIEGWVTIADTPERTIHLDIMLGDAIIGHCVADRFRQDLLDAGLGDGHCAFQFPMPGFVPKSEISHVRLRLENSVAFLDFKRPGQAQSVTGVSRDTISRFGGLWIDRFGWLDKLALKHRTGELSDELCDQIFKFARDGYLVIGDAVPDETVSRLNEEIERAWRNPPEGMRVETFETDGKMRLTAPELALRPGRTKLLDLMAFSETARRAIAAPKVVAFLAAIFEDKPKAFQSLTFWNGSQQAIHKDTAYVRIDSNPMHLAATWLALEDVEPGTGELEYYVGSHRAPDYLFGGTGKWMEAHTEEHERFLASLHEDARTYSQVKRSFLGKAGDVLIWHADLAHGGAPIKQQGRSRRSLVTHFTASEDEPFYRRKSPYVDFVTEDCVYVSQYRNISIEW